MRPLTRLYSETPILEFGPNALRAVQNWWVEEGACRMTVNTRISKALRALKWAASRELISGETVYALSCVEPLRKGRTKARDYPPVSPVPWHQVEPVLEVVQPQIRAMILLLWNTGARPGEACKIRGCEIDTSKTPWVWTPEHHKTAYRGRRRVIYIGPEGRKVLKEWLRKKPPRLPVQPPGSRDPAARERPRNRKLRSFYRSD